MAKKEGVELRGPQIRPLTEQQPSKKILSTILFIILGLILIISLLLNTIQFFNQSRITQEDIDKLTQRITELQEDNARLEQELTQAQTTPPTDKQNLDHLNKINQAKKELKILIDTIDIESQKDSPDNNVLKTKTNNALQTIDELIDKLRKHNLFLSQNNFQELNKETQIEINELNIKELEETKTMLQLIKNQIP